MGHRLHVNYGLGIDVGTTFTAAAIWRDERVEVVALETSRVAVPTVVFASGDELAFGGAAVSRAMARPAGVAREFKRRLGDPVPLMLSGAPYSAERLVALFAQWVVRAVTEQIGEPPDRVAITRPANWTEFQLHLLVEALERVDLGGAALFTEPQAAAVDFGAAARLEPGQLVVVYDLGGGTFDVALLRREAVGFVHVGEPAGVEHLGGIDFDQAVFQHAIDHVPAEAVSQARLDQAGRIAIAQLHRACIEAKESLSSEVAVDIPVVLPGGTSRTVRLTRSEFEDMIRPMINETVQLVQQVVTRAGITVSELSAVLLVGGSSRIPLVSELVREQLHAPVRIDAHPKLVVSRGAARYSVSAEARKDGGSGRHHPRHRKRWWSPFVRSQSGRHDRGHDPSSPAPGPAPVGERERIEGVIATEPAEPAVTALEIAGIEAELVGETTEGDQSAPEPIVPAETSAAVGVEGVGTSAPADEVPPLVPDRDAGSAAPAESRVVPSSTVSRAPPTDDQATDRLEADAVGPLADTEPDAVQAISDRSTAVEPPPEQAAMEKMIVAPPDVPADRPTAEDRPSPAEVTRREADDIPGLEELAPPIIETSPARAHPRRRAEPTSDQRRHRRAVGVAAAVAAGGVIIAAIVVIAAGDRQDAETGRDDTVTDLTTPGDQPAANPPPVTTADVSVTIENPPNTSASTSPTAVDTTIASPPSLPSGYKGVEFDLQSMVVSLGAPAKWIPVEPDDLNDPSVRDRLAEQIGAGDRSRGQGILADTIDKKCCGIPHIFSNDGEGASISLGNYEDFPTLDELSASIEKPGVFIGERRTEDNVGDGAIWLRYRTDPTLTTDPEDTSPIYGHVLVVDFESDFVVVLVKSLHEDQVERVSDTIAESLVRLSSQPGSADRPAPTRQSVIDLQG